jgi:hypothetical protein
LWEIPEGEVADLQTSADRFAMLHAQADSPTNNSVIVKEKNTARAALEKKIRTLAGFRLKNPAISHAERVALGLHARDAKPSDIPAPRSRPELNIDVLDFRRLKVLFHDMGSATKAKPYGVSGAVIAYAALDSPPASPDALTCNALASRTPHILEFAEEERGKTVYIAICWHNVKGEKGPWSEIESAIVP